jgi:hypothetical protein
MVIVTWLDSNTLEIAYSAATSIAERRERAKCGNRSYTVRYRTFDV